MFLKCDWCAMVHFRTSYLIIHWFIYQELKWWLSTTGLFGTSDQKIKVKSSSSVLITFSWLFLAYYFPLERNNTYTYSRIGVFYGWLPHLRLVQTRCNKFCLSALSAGALSHASDVGLFLAELADSRVALHAIITQDFRWTKTYMRLLECTS